MKAKFTAGVRTYLADCAANPGLSRKYHPTAEGALKMIPHHGKDEADQIRAAFARERSRRTDDKPGD